jgi:histidinol-phosphate/aromatic aminotransferase/cobyric acid decarboxylase-like protein
MLCRSMSPLAARPLHAEHGGASFEALGLDFSRLDRIGEIVNADVLDAWYDPSPVAVAAVQEHLAWFLRTSPPTHSEGLVGTIAAVRGVDRESLIVGSGTSSLVYSVLPHLVKPGDRPLVLDPMYGEYAHWFEAVEGIRCARSVLLSERGYEVDPEAYLRELGGADVAVLVNPNSPTGRAVSPAFLRAVLDALPRFGWLVVDETYSEFAGEDTSIETWVEREEKLLVVRSLSKFWALSGVRVGYVAAHPSVARRLLPYNPPWAVGLVAQVAAIEALRDGGYYRAMAERTRELRGGLASSLSSIPGLRVIPSVTNFLLLELPPGPSAADVVASAGRQGVYLRNCDAQMLRPTGRLVRTAVKDAPANARIAAAVRDALQAPDPGSTPVE